MSIDKGSIGKDTRQGPQLIKMQSTELHTIKDEGAYKPRSETKRNAQQSNLQGLGFIGKTSATAGASSENKKDLGSITKVC